MNAISWVIIGLVLLGIEMIAPVTYFLWLGVSALVTAAIVYFLGDLVWQGQFLLFSGLSVFSIWISKKYLVGRQTKSEVPNLNRRAQQYIGRVVTLSEAIEQGEGKIRVDDTYWQVKGPPLPEGTEVKIISAKGSVLQVDRVQ